LQLLQHSKTNLEQICDQGRDEHVVEPIVLIVQDILETAAAAERHQDADVAGLDAGAEERDQIVVPKLTHLQHKDVQLERGL